MRLDSASFLVVFAAFFVVYTVAPRALKRILLVVGNVAFYATLAPRYIPLLLGLGVFTFVVAARLQREPNEKRRDLLLWLGAGVNVLALAFFKTAFPIAGVIAPLGLSFYALQAVSCIVDVHRRVFDAPRSLWSFLASFTLFPHLLSGPIVRSSFLVPLVERADPVSWTVARRAMLLFVAGLAKKAIADKLAPVANSAFDAANDISMLHAWTGLLAYAGQLYGDFSGYTDMATALALLLGLDLPKNFDLPYLATSPADFWRRWHISLSSWLRDYVYLPLGVRFRRRRYVNIVLTWIVAGLWHGVSGLYVLYGFYHGVLLAGTEWLSRRFGVDIDEEPRGVRRFAQTAVTFYLVLMGYVLFRAKSLPAAARFFLELHESRVPSNASSGMPTTLATCVAAIAFCHALDYAVRRWRDDSERAWILWPAMVLATTCIVVFESAAQPFIYFSF